MRRFAFAALLLAACHPQSAQLSFEGADYKTDAAKIAHGKRLATVLDCAGCHGQNLQGTNLADKPEDGAMYAPNVTLLLGKYSDGELDKLIRHGVPKDGRQFWFMPVESFQFLSDRACGALDIEHQLGVCVQIASPSGDLGVQISDAVNYGHNILRAQILVAPVL